MCAYIVQGIMVLNSLGCTLGITRRSPRIVKAAINCSRVHFPIPVPSSWVILEERTMHHLEKKFTASAK